MDRRRFVSVLGTAERGCWIEDFAWLCGVCLACFLGDCEHSMLEVILLYILACSGGCHYGIFFGHLEPIDCTMISSDEAFSGVGEPVHNRNSWGKAKL